MEYLEQGSVKLTLVKTDAEWSKVVLEGGGRVCSICGEAAGDPHHLIYRRFRKTRLIVENGVCLCHKHHVWMHKDGRAHV